MNISTDESFSKLAHQNNTSDYEDVFSDRCSSWRYGSEQYKDEYLKTRFDPKKGKRLCQDDIKSTMASKDYRSIISQALTYKKRLKHRDMGSKISVPRAISGEEQYFVTTDSAQRPTVKIAINMCVSCGCDDDMLMKIARSAIPTVYALETAGICTEIWLSTFSVETHFDVPFEYTVSQVRIKSAQERFNWTTFAPVFTTGSYRHGFFLSWLCQPYKIASGYGHPMSTDIMSQHDNYGYAVIIGNNTPGPVDLVKEVFSKIKTPKS